MKRIVTVFFVFLVSLIAVVAAEPESTAFPGVQKAMTPEDYEAAGLSKLGPEERAKLDEFIRNYVAVSNDRVATNAVEKAVKEKKAVAPEIIQSRIVGPFTGYTGRTVFQLENGQRWVQSQLEEAHFPKVDNPPVVIVKAGFGYRMHIAGGGAIRVSKKP
jgi:NADH pyrophosphatase NudC (nudix superfamily)